MSDNPCHRHCDWTDGDEADVTYTGCCSPLPIRISCEAPVLPVPECDEEEPTIEFNEETEEFFILGKLYDQDCSPLLDSSASQLTGLIA